MDEGAAFGFFPQLRPRRRLQDPTASADVPLQVLRGRLAGLLGLPSDIGNIVRSPQPMEAFGSYDYEKPEQLPYTTEQFLKELPLAPTAPIGQLAGQAASFVPLNPAPLARGVQKVGTMVGEGMAERVATGRPMLPSLLAEPPSAMFAVEPNVPRMNLLDTPPETMTSLLEVKPQAAVSDLGFYSAAEQAALNLQRNKGSGQSFLSDLLKAENVKKDELQWMGVDDFLKEKPNVTKQEVQDFIANNRVDVQEVTLGNPLTLSEQAEIRALREKDRMSMSDRARFDTLSSREDSGTSPKYSKYQLPGGENYREILMTLPTNMSEYNKYTQVLREKYGQGGFQNLPLTDIERARLDKFYAAEEAAPYKSSHFDEPNILAHIRVNDRVDADGKKMLLIEEIQSDWHQAGREKGYKTGKERDPAQVEKELTITTQKRSRLIDEAAALPDSEMTKFKAMNEEIKKLGEQATKLDEEWTNLLNKPEGVPDAPFKDTWYQLALKRVLKHAADNGYERVGLTTGKQQAGRYKLSNEVDEINVIGRTDMATGEKSKSVALDMKSGQSLRIGVNNDGIVDNVSDESIKKFMGKNLSEVVGKDIAKEIMLNNKKTISGEGLDIGGEGMKKYYDEIYPKFLDKYGKKWNARVGETQITTDYARDANGIPAQRPSKESIRYIDITPEMKGAVSKGQPLFAATPALPLGAQGLLGEPEKKKELSLLD